MLESFFGSTEIEFSIKTTFALAAGIIVGVERESRGKPAGISTQALVISSAMLFAF